MLRAKIAAWDDPEKSIGQKTTKVKGKTVWEAKGPAKEIFDEKLSGIIKELLEANKEDLEFGEETSQTASFNLWMVGRKPQSARPTVIVACRSSTYRTNIKRLLEEKSVLADFPGIALKTMERMPAKLMGQEHDSCSEQCRREVPDLEDGVVYLRPGNSNVCGSSILVGNNHEATLGGTLLIDGKYYGFTTLHSHMGRAGSVESLIAPDAELAFDDDSEISSIRTQSLRSKYSTSVLSFQYSSIDISSTAVDTFDEKHPQASSDEENFCANLQRIGTVILGSTRSTLDYDIFPIEDSSLHVANQIPLPRAHGRPQEFLNIETILTQIIESEVWVVAGKSGLLKGTIMNNPYFIKIAGSDSYQKMWPVKLERNIVPGDCGSWVIDAQSGGLYGHVVAGDSTLNRAYIIAAADVIRDVSVRFGYDPVLQRHSRPVFQSAQFDPQSPSEDDFLCESSNESVADDDLRPASPVHPQRTKGLSKHSRNVRSYLSDYFAKIWDPIFSTDRNIKDNSSYVELLEMNDLANGCEIGSLWGMEDSVPSYEIEELIDFCAGARLVDLETATGIAGQRRSAWIDDRSCESSSSDQSVRKYSNLATTATGLYRRLKLPRFPHNQEDLVDANRRLIYIRNLDPYFVLALARTASFDQFSVLRDAIWKHLTFQTSIRVRIPKRFRAFNLEIHIPYFELRRNQSTQHPLVEKDNYKIPRHWTDISFLKTPGRGMHDQETHIIYESHFSFIICGTDNNRWVGYAFADAHFDDEEELEDAVFPYDGVHLDPISSCELDAGDPIWDPRGYFLTVLKIRLAKVLVEWEILVRVVERSIRQYQRQEFSTQCKGSKNESTQTEGVKEVFDWNQQAMKVLNQLIDVLSETIKTWEVFISPNGDIEYFCDIEKKGLSSRISMGRIFSSLRAIKETVETLECLHRKLLLLEKSCGKSAEALQLRLTLEANEAVKSNGAFTYFTVSLISPILVAITFFSIPQTVSGFPKLEFKYFFVAIIFIMVVMQLLFFGSAVLPLSPRRWKKLSLWRKKLQWGGEFRRFWIRERHSSHTQSIGADGPEMMKV